MSDYEKEKQELWEWLQKEQKEIDKIPFSGGLDGPHTVKSKELTREFNRRLIALNKKYDKG